MRYLTKRQKWAARAARKSDVAARRANEAIAYLSGPTKRIGSQQIAAAVRRMEAVEWLLADIGDLCDLASGKQTC